MCCQGLMWVGTHGSRVLNILESVQGITWHPKQDSNAAVQLRGDESKVAQMDTIVIFMPSPPRCVNSKCTCAAVCKHGCVGPQMRCGTLMAATTESICATDQQ